MNEAVVWLAITPDPTTHCANAAARTASTADPPRRSASRPASAARGWPDATPPVMVDEAITR